MKKRFVLILILVFIVSFASNVYASSSKRLAGENRYDTSASIAQDGWEQSDYAILAYGGNYPDALSAAPLAKKYDAPILLTSGNNLPAVTKETLISLQVKNVFIIGGTGVIPSSIDSELKSMKISVTRIAGQDRYETAIKVAQQLPSPTEIFVVTGEDYPDALSIAPIAALKHEPIILVPKNYMPDSVKAYLSANSINKTYVVGDSDIIDDNVFNQFPGSERIIGVDKYVRNINVNIKFDDLFNSKDICIATGEGFADALTGAAYAAKKGIPIVLVNNYPPPFTRLYTIINLNMADAINGIPYIFGGTGVVTDKAVAYLYTLPSEDQANKPSAPTNLVATAISSSEITIQWDPVSDADYYYVYLRDDREFISACNDEGSKIQYKWVPRYSFNLYQIDANTTWHFKVTAVKNGVESDYSNVSSATTFSSDPVAPITEDTVIHGPLKLIADDAKHTYLGTLTTNKFDTESVFNEFGIYGSEFSSKSIYNEFGTFGSEFSIYSPFNEFTSKPPLIIDADGNVVGRLSVNEFVIGAVSPYTIFDTLTNLGF